MLSILHIIYFLTLIFGKFYQENLLFVILSSMYDILLTTIHDLIIKEKKSVCVRIDSGRN